MRQQIYGYVIGCDEPDCDANFIDEWYARPLSDDDQIELAEDHGWTYRFIDGHEDFRCPDHSAHPPTEAPEE